MKALKCTGVEATVQECAWSDPDAACMTHLSDSVIYCTSEKPGEAVAEGSLRLIGASGPQFSSFFLFEIQSRYVSLVYEQNKTCCAVVGPVTP